MAETHYEAIKNFSEDEMAQLLRHMMVGIGVPLRYNCEYSSCYECKENLVCFKDWLKWEVKYETKHNDTE